jgi:ubiquinone/menaquinone biosynthesis C-methylase UbiE
LFPEKDVPVVLSEVHRVLKPAGRPGVVSMARGRPGSLSALWKRPLFGCIGIFRTLWTVTPLMWKRPCSPADFGSQSPSRSKSGPCP